MACFAFCHTQGKVRPQDQPTRTLDNCNQGGCRLLLPTHRCYCCFQIKPCAGLLLLPLLTCALNNGPSGHTEPQLMATEMQ